MEKEYIGKIYIYTDKRRGIYKIYGTGKLHVETQGKGTHGDGTYGEGHTEKRHGEGIYGEGTYGKWIQREKTHGEGTYGYTQNTRNRKVTRGDTR